MPSSKQLANLTSFSAEDTHGDTVPVSAKISKGDRDALDALPGDRSWKIRQAIREYINSNKPPENP
jgi:hypothetical protein